MQTEFSPLGFLSQLTQRFGQTPTSGQQTNTVNQHLKPSTQTTRLNSTAPAFSLDGPGNVNALASLGSLGSVGGLTAPGSIGKNNPFLPAPVTSRPTGQNQPFIKPMFLGYHNDTALYGGARLFVLS